MADDSLTLFDKFDEVLSTSKHANVANQFYNYDEKKFHAHFWLSKTVIKYVIDDITIQLHKHL